MATKDISFGSFKHCTLLIEEDSSMFCGHCGSKMNKTDIFCTECGKKQLQEGQGTPPASVSDAAWEVATPTTSEFSSKEPDLQEQETTSKVAFKTLLGVGGIATVCAAFVILVIIGLFLIFRTSYVEVPDFSNLTEEEASQLIEESRLTVGEITEEYSGRVEAGLVISQSPRAGREVERGTSIDLTISSGEESVRVPLFTNLRLGVAEMLISELGLSLGDVDEEFSDTEGRGVVIAQSIPAGSIVEKGTNMDLVVSLGPEPVTVPDSTGLTEDEDVPRPPSVSPFDLDVWGEDQIVTLEYQGVSVDVPIPPWLNDVIDESLNDEDFIFDDRVRGFVARERQVYVMDRESDVLKTMVEVTLLDMSDFDGDFLAASCWEFDRIELFLRGLYYNFDAVPTDFYHAEGEFTSFFTIYEYPEDGSHEFVSIYEIIRFNEYNGIMIRTRLRLRTVNAPEAVCSEEFASAYGLWKYIDAGYMELDE